MTLAFEASSAYTQFALKPVGFFSGREPTFLLGGDSLGLTGQSGPNMDLERIRAAAERVARSEGLEVVDVEWRVGKQRFLRVYIDRSPASSEPGQVLTPPEPERRGTVSGGISHADCERVSHQLSVILDVEDLVPGPGYTLEISSPGLDRKLVKPADYERFRGRLAKISTAEPVENAKFFEGRIAGYENGIVRVELKGREPRTVEVPFATIRKANLVVEF